MAFVRPQNPSFKNNAEKIVYYSIKNNLPYNYVSYFNYYTINREFDYIIIVPGLGIVTLEVKGWQPDRIIDVLDNNCVIYKNSAGFQDSFTSPLKQANDYRFELLNKIEDELGKNIKVIPIVCYPYINEDDYLEKGLNVISPRQFTLLKDDLVDSQSFESCLNNTFKNFNIINPDNLNPNLVLDIRSFYENNPEKIEKCPEDDEQGITAEKSQEREYYSILKFLSSEISDQDIAIEIDNLVKNWCRGTKILLISNSKDIIYQAQLKLFRRINHLNLQDHFKLISDKDKEKDISLKNMNQKKKKLEFKDFIFNFFFYHIESTINNFYIYDGEADKIKKYKANLEIIDRKSSFNLNQYMIEHAAIKKNIVVRAGAGSGKTFSMIARISYLIYAEKLDYDSIKESILLITFTNEAAKNMKERLQEYIIDYYLLTKDYRFFKMIQALDDMNISTIHSLVRKILENNSVELGLGKDFDIVSGYYQRKMMIEEVLNEFIEEERKRDSNFTDKLNLSMYHLQRILGVIISKLENKNIDIVAEWERLDFGSSLLPELDKTIRTVLYRSEKKLRKQLKDENKVRLGNLIIRLKSMLGNGIILPDLNVDYVFVDEFQDTDDIQIDLMNQFQELLGFKFFIVGDIKQCIYRFRGAQHRAFQRLLGLKDDEDDNIISRKWGLSFTLNKNYRSDALLLEKFEKIFSNWGQGRQQKLNYDSSDKLISHINLNNPDSVFFKEVLIKDTNDEEEFEKVFVAEIRRQYGYLEKDGTLAILVRENKDIEEIVRIGRKYGIHIEAEVGGDLFRLRPIHDLYKLIIALQHPTSPKYIYNLFNTSYISINNPLPKLTLYEMKKSGSDKKDFYNYFYHDCPIKNWEDALQEIKKQPVLKVLRDLVLANTPWNNFAEEYNNVDKESDNLKAKRFYKRNLDKVFELLINHSRSEYLTLNRIEKYLKVMILTGQDEQSRESSLSESTEEKRIICLTVHKSKGLEFETVLLPFTRRDLQDQKKSGYVDVITTEEGKIGYKLRLDDKIEEISSFGKIYQTYYLKNNHYKDEEEREQNYKLYEETRILYVAMTRAMKRFIFFSHTGAVPEESWQNLIKEG